MGRILNLIYSAQTWTLHVRTCDEEEIQTPFIQFWGYYLNGSALLFAAHNAIPVLLHVL